MPQVSKVDLTRYYILALLIVGSLAIGSHLLQQTAIENQQGLGAIINLSGRQRMLSQRIASLAAQYRLGDPTAKPALLDAANRFEAAHQMLASKYQAQQKEDESKSLQKAYFDGVRSMDAAVHEYITTARQVASLEPNDPAMQPLLTQLFAESRMPLLEALDQVVQIHQVESETRVKQLRHLQWTILAIMLATLLLEAFLIFRPMVQRIVAYNAEILHLATTDYLTGVLNRREFFTRTRAECDRVVRHGGSLSVVMLDVDHFKKVNDTYGHAAGDAVLKSVCASIGGNLRSNDLLGRLGGEEFAILTPNTARADAMEFADRLREALAATKIAADAAIIDITVSMGVAQFTPAVTDVEHTMDLADQRLYEAKRAGRNRVVG